MPGLPGGDIGCPRVETHRIELYLLGRELPILSCEVTIVEKHIHKLSRPAVRRPPSHLYRIYARCRTFPYRETLQRYRQKMTM